MRPALSLFEDSCRPFRLSYPLKSSLTASNGKPPTPAYNAKNDEHRQYSSSGFICRRDCDRINTCRRIRDAASRAGVALRCSAAMRRNGRHGRCDEIRSDNGQSAHLSSLVRNSLEGNQKYEKTHLLPHPLAPIPRSTIPLPPTRPPIRASDTLRRRALGARL